MIKRDADTMLETPELPDAAAPPPVTDDAPLRGIQDEPVPAGEGA